MTKGGYVALTLMFLALGWLYVRYKQMENRVATYGRAIMTPENYIEYVATMALQEGYLRPEGRLALLVILDERGCATCIRVEIDHLNRYWSELKTFTHVVYVGGQGIYLKQSHFDYEQVPEAQDVWGRTMPPVNPVALLFLDGRLVTVRWADPTTPFYEAYTTAWYEGIRVLRALVHEMH